MIRPTFIPLDRLRYSSPIHPFSEWSSERENRRAYAAPAHRMAARLRVAGRRARRATEAREQQ